jgi:hypothetical protein
MENQSQISRPDLKFQTGFFKYIKYRDEREMYDLIALLELLGCKLYPGSIHPDDFHTGDSILAGELRMTWMQATCSGMEELDCNASDFIEQNFK